MAKSSIHPTWYPNAKVYCDGQLVLKLGSTKPSLNVDIWSGNHPFYTGSQKIIDTDKTDVEAIEGQVTSLERQITLIDAEMEPSSSAEF